MSRRPASRGERNPGPQRIPRPPASRPGGPPPWDGVDVERITLDEVRHALTGHGDLPAVDEFAEIPQSAVLAPLFEEDGEVRVILTRRAPWLRSHTHQVAFPGGRVDPGETLEQAALREAQEEIGLDPASVEIIGRLNRLATMSSGAAIHPFVGVLRDGRPHLVPNPDEVERVFDVPLSELMEDGVFAEERWGVGDIERPVYFFELDGDTVWGATASMLRELLALVVSERRGRPAPER